MHKDVTITINGEEYHEHIPVRLLLVDFIRDVAGLTGTHVGCTYEGVCGACTIQIDGSPPTPALVSRKRPSFCGSSKKRR